MDFQPNIRNKACTGQIYSGVFDPMHGNYRRIILAAVGWLILGNGNVEGGVNQPLASEQGNQVAAALPTPTPSPAGAVGNLDHATRYRNPCGYSDTHEDSDLCAQWTAARAADSTGPWYARNYGLAVIQTIAGLLTLAAAVAAAIFAGKAAKETEKGSSAALDAVAATNAANDISRDTAARQLRAYAGILKAILFVPQATPSHAKIFVQNFGSTPANNVITRHRVAWHAEPIAVPDYEEPSGLGIMEPSAGKDATIVLHGDLITPALVAERRAVGQYLIVYFRMDYTDYLGHPHWREIAYFIDPLTGPKDGEWRLSLWPGKHNGD